MTNVATSVTQALHIKSPIDFNNGVLPNLDPIEPVSQSDLLKRQQSASYSNNVRQLDEIVQGKNLFIKLTKPIDLVNLIRMSAVTKTSVDILNINGNIIHTINDINRMLYNDTVLDYIIKNIDNDFQAQELENYSVLLYNNIPISITESNISIIDSAILHYLLITLPLTDYSNILTLERDITRNRLYKLEIAMRFNIDTVKSFPLEYP